MTNSELKVLVAQLDSHALNLRNSVNSLLSCWKNNLNPAKQYITNQIHVINQELAVILEFMPQILAGLAEHDIDLTAEQPIEIEDENDDED